MDSKCILFFLRNRIFLNSFEFIRVLLAVNKFPASEKSLSLEVEQEYTARYLLAILLNIGNFSCCPSHYIRGSLSKLISLRARYSVTSLVTNVTGFLKLARIELYFSDFFFFFEFS